jgi:tetratricopeptide (TPR) repeat protein
VSFVLAFLLISPVAFAQEPEQPPAPPAGNTVNWEKNLQAALDKAKEKDQMILVFFYKEDSKMCADFESYGINQPAVVELSKNFLCVKVERDKDKEDSARFGIKVVPVTLFLDANQKKLGMLRGYEEPEPFAKRVKEVYESIDKEKKARETLSEDPENLEANLVLAKIWVIRDYRDQAMALFKKVVTGDASNKKGLLVEAAFRLGQLEFENGMFDEAKKSFEKVKKHDPTNEKGYADDMLLAEAHMDMTDQKAPNMDAALKKLQLFTVKYADSELMPQALFRMGYAHYQKNDNTKAIETWEKLVKEYPNTAEAERVKYMIQQLKEQQGK